MTITVEAVIMIFYIHILTEGGSIGYLYDAPIGTSPMTVFHTQEKRLIDTDYAMHVYIVPAIDMGRPRSDILFIMQGLSTKDANMVYVRDPR